MQVNHDSHTGAQAPPWQFIKETDLPKDDKEDLIFGMKYMIRNLKFPPEKARRWVESQIKAAHKLEAST